jgi:glucose/arabinose dehydrogenase
MKPRRLLTVAALVVLVLAASPPFGDALPTGTRVATYKSGLNFPIDMVWVKGTRKIFFTEKSGAIRVMKGRRLLGRPCATLPVDSEGERGALGIALHPRFKKNHKLYVFYTHSTPAENRVARFIVDNNRCTRKRDILKNLGGSSGYHNGGQLEFVGGKLFVSVGEAHDPDNAQSKKNRLGKILRVNPNGSVPAGNPFGNAIWSYGHRNPFGLAHKPGTSWLYETENGPDCDDELNRIRKGRNYGWGSGYQCGTAGVGSDPKRPLRRWGNIIVPTDPWWYRGRMKTLSGDLYVGDYATGRLHRIVMNDRGTRLRRDRIVYDSSTSIVDVAKGPGGWLYFMTPNAIFRVVPN